MRDDSSGRHDCKHYDDGHVPYHRVLHRSGVHDAGCRRGVINHRARDCKGTKEQINIGAKEGKV